MKRKETMQVVFGAMMLALYGLLVVVDLYTGSLFNVFLYYLMPLPFVVYALYFGLKMTLALMIGALFISFLLAVPETIFFSISAMMVSLVLYWGISHKKSGRIIFMSTLLVTSFSQLLSISAFASLLGYNIQEEFAQIQTLLGINDQMMNYLIPAGVVIVGGMEAFIFVTFTDVLLWRLKLAKIPSFSLVTMHLSKKEGLLCLLMMVLGLYGEITLLRVAGILALVVLIVQGLSFLLFYHLCKKHGRWTAVVSLLGCFVPILNLLYAFIGLYDIFSEIRRKLLYNRANR